MAGAGGAAEVGVVMLVATTAGPFSARVAAEGGAAVLGDGGIAADAAATVAAATVDDPADVIGAFDPWCGLDPPATAPAVGAVAVGSCCCPGTGGGDCC